MAFTDGIDSYYVAIKNRLATINPQRAVGYMASQDWPPPKIQVGKLYLALPADPPVGPEHGTIANPVVTHLAQWSWIVMGSDLAPNLRMRNRGDRARLDVAIKDELVRAHYPNFTQKFAYTVDNSGNIVLAAANLQPAIAERVCWTRVQFSTKLDKESGMVYGAASVHIVDMLDQITS